MVATVVELATKAMFDNHYYGFNGRKFKQREGGPIGLRGTCTIARLTMQAFDRLWGELVGNSGLVIALYMRYMDDGRKFLHPIKRGWRWIDNTLQYTLRWEMEDLVKTPMEMTRGIIEKSINGIMQFLEFTTETGDDYADGWLPTLDTSLRVNGRNIVEYRYYEKPTTTNATIRKTTAMSENPKIQCLSNDLIRRLLNTKEELPCEYREEVIANYGRKLLTSGYGRDQVKKIL